MRCYKVVWTLPFIGVDMVGEDYIFALSCQSARDYILSHLPDTTKIAVRPHYGERPC